MLLKELACNGPSHSCQQIPRLGGRSVYKGRLPIPSMNLSARKGARLIYYCDEHLVCPLFLYRKNVKEDIPIPEIVEALKGLDLW